MKYLYLLFFILSAQILVAQQVTLKKGMVTDNIIIADSTHKETFAIYLPTYYSNDKTWPIIFVFDAEGRGKIVTQLFKQTAEDQGYIIAASNNIKQSNELAENVQVSERLIETVRNYFSVDNRFIYTAGLNEGAEAAMALSSISKNTKGVLAIGDYWINTKFLKQGSGFAFVGMINYKDPDYYTLADIANYISKIGYPARIYKFIDDHEYPSADLIYSGIGEFTLQRIKTDTTSSSLINSEKLFQHDIQMADNMRRQLNFYQAYEFLEVMQDKYIDDKSQDIIKDSKKQIRKNKIYKEQRRRHNAASTKENYKKTQYSYYLGEDLAQINFENLGYWNQEIKDLEESQKSGNMAEQEMGYRLQGHLQNMAEESFTQFSESKANIDLLIYTAVLETIFDKENPKGYFDVISLSASDGDYATSMLYLEDLLKTGYKNIDALYNIPGTLDLKLSPEYNLLIKKYIGKSKFYNLNLNEK